MTGGAYHLANIRDLLVQGFDEKQLRTFCYYQAEFRPLHERLATDAGRTEIADDLVEYAERTLLLDALLAWAQAQNPARFEQHGPYHLGGTGIATLQKAPELAHPSAASPSATPSPRRTLKLPGCTWRIALMISASLLVLAGAVVLLWMWVIGPAQLRARYAAGEIHFSNSYLWRVNLSGADLSGIDLSYANLRGANLSDADLSEANLGWARMRGANLSYANLSGAKLPIAMLHRALLGEADLRGADLNRADLSGADLTRADLRWADLRDANMGGANLVNADLRGADLTWAELSGAKLVGANLDDSTQIEAKWRTVWQVLNRPGDVRDMLDDTDLSGAFLYQADLRGASLHGANLNSADLNEADLSGADLTGADLAGASLIGANLSSAQLAGANLRGADLDGTDLSDANLNGAQVIPDQLSKAASLQGATLPDGTRHE
jgi:uncharacterized protein YjbI with pentapeptide repeats